MTFQASNGILQPIYNCLVNRFLEVSGLNARLLTRKAATEQLELGFEFTTLRSQVQHLNHSAKEPTQILHARKLRVCPENEDDWKGLDHLKNNWVQNKDDWISVNIEMLELGSSTKE